MTQRRSYFFAYLLAGLFFAFPFPSTAADSTQGTACTGTTALAISGSTTGASVVSPAGGNNLVCISGTWQYPTYQFGSTTASCTSTNAGAVKYSTGTMYYCNGSAWLPFSPSCYGSNSGSDAALASNLVAYWKLDENAGITLYDATGNGNIGTFQGSTSPWVTGISGSALQFDGTNYAFTNFTVGSFGTDSFTVAGWYKTTADTGYMISKRTTCGYDFFYDIQKNRSTLSAEIDAGSGSTYYFLHDTSTTSDGNWHHFAFVKGGSTLNLYRDGSSVASANTGSALNLLHSQPMLSFATDPCSGNFSGSLDEIGIWNTALTSTQVSTLYNSGIGNTLGAMVCPVLINSSGGFTN